MQHLRQQDHTGVILDEIKHSLVCLLRGFSLRGQRFDPPVPE